MNKKDDKRKIETRIFNPIREALDQEFAEIDKASMGENARSDLTDGFGFLHDLIEGTKNPSVSIITASSSLGSTRSLGGKIAAGLATRFDIAIACFSMNATSGYFSSIMLAFLAKVNHNYMRIGKLPSNQWPHLSTAAGKLADSSIHIDDAKYQTVQSLKEGLQELIGEFPVDLVMLDNLQRILQSDIDRAHDNSYSRTLEDLIKVSIDLNVSMLILSQVPSQLGTTDFVNKQDHEYYELVPNYGFIADSELFLISSGHENDQSFKLHVYRNREGGTGVIDVI